MTQPPARLAPAVRRLARAVTLAAAATAPPVALSGCAARSAHAGRSAAAAPGDRGALVADRLVFGRAIPGGGTVSDSAWDAFAREVVAPRFPDGLSVWRGEGQWRDRATGAVVREPTVVLELFHAAGADVDAALGEIAAAYKRRFRQDAVLRVTTAASVRLLDD